MSRAQRRRPGRCTRTNRPRDSCASPRPPQSIYLGNAKCCRGAVPFYAVQHRRDEINARCYADDAQTQHDLDGRTLEQALDDFTQATHGALRKLGKTPVVWEGATYLSSNCKGPEDFCFVIEMVLNYNLTLSNDTIALYVTG